MPRAYQGAAERWRGPSRLAGAAGPPARRGPGVPGSADEGGALVGYWLRLHGLRWRRRFDVEQIADPLERPDPTRLARLGAELAAHARHPDTEVLEVIAVLGPPHLGEELGMEDDLASVRGEVLEEQPLRAGELDEVPVPGHHPALEIDLDVVELEDARARARARGAAQDRADSCGELVRVEGLGDVIVGAQVEALRLVGRRSLRREQDDRDGTPFPQLAHDLDAVEVGHDDVEQDDVRPDLLSLLQSLFAAIGRDDPEALLTEGDGYELRDPRLVVCDEDEGLGTQPVPPRVSAW